MQVQCLSVSLQCTNIEQPYGLTGAEAKLGIAQRAKTTIDLKIALKSIRNDVGLGVKALLMPLQLAIWPGVSCRGSSSRWGCETSFGV